MPNRRIAFALLVSGCAGGTFAGPTADRFQTALNETHTSQAAPGTQMLVVDNDGRRWFGAAGMADREAGVPVTEATLLGTASIAKTFTGALVLALHEEGRLHVDDPIDRYIDGIPDGDQITLRMLLQHTSGIANYTQLETFTATVATGGPNPFTYRDLVDLAVAAGPAFTPPGSAWSYSNTGYILLGMLVEAAVGRPLEDELEARWFGPLGMRDTAPLTQGIPSELWTAYVPGESGLVRAPRRMDGFYFPADGGWVTSVADLVVWGRAFFGGALLAPETMVLAQQDPGGSQMLGVVASEFGLETGGYGLGLIVAEDRAFGALIAGAGNGGGTRSFVGFLPKTGTVFVVGVNRGDGRVPIVESLSAAGPIIDAVRAASAAGEL